MYFVQSIAVWWIVRRVLLVLHKLASRYIEYNILVFCTMYCCIHVLLVLHTRASRYKEYNILVFSTKWYCIRVLLVLHTRASRWRRAAPICSNQLIEFPLCGNCGNLPNSENYSISTAPAPSATRGVCPAAPKLVSQKREIYSKTKFNPTEHTLGALGREK